MVIARFRLASLSMDTILAGATIHQKRQALCGVVNGLGFHDAYSTTLDRIRQQGGNRSKLGMDALMWVSHCERPLRLEELRYALGVEPGVEDFNIHNVPSIRTILDCTLGLVTIDQNTSIARLLHPTLQEYLRQDPTPIITAHSMMAEICLTYLNDRSIQSLQPNSNDDFGATPFLQYATCFWGAHAARGVTEPVKSLSLRLLDGYENHVSSAIFWREKICERYSEGDVEGISGLHCIAFWGVAEIAIPMLEMKRFDMNGRDSRGDTPLMWAIRYGNKKVVEMLLKQVDIRPDAVIRDGRTVLSFAAELGNEGAARLLLKHGDVDPDSSDDYGRTPLSFAAEGGHEDVAKLLLQRGDVNPHSLDNGGQTPLSYATTMGREGVMKALLEDRMSSREPLEDSDRMRAPPRPPQTQPPPSVPSPRDQLNLPVAPWTPISALNSGFPSFFLLTLILSTSLCFVFVLCSIYSDS